MSTSYQMDDYVPSGSSLRGHIHASYTDLVKVFGEPNILNAEPSGDDKVHNEWGIRFFDGDDDTYATIYDWKENWGGASRVGDYVWHIGGHNHEAVELVYEALGK